MAPLYALARYHVEDARKTGDPLEWARAVSWLLEWLLSEET